MRAIRNLIFLTAILGILAAGTPTSAASTYLGEFCWSVYENVGHPPSAPVWRFPLTAGVTHLGGSYYLIQGRVDRRDLGDVPPLFFQATGVIIGDELWLNGTATREAPIPSLNQTQRYGGIMQVRLSLSTLSGTFWRIETDIATTDGAQASFFQRYITGTADFTPCP